MAKHGSSDWDYDEITAFVNLHYIRSFLETKVSLLTWLVMIWAHSDQVLQIVNFGVWYPLVLEGSNLQLVVECNCYRAALGNSCKVGGTEDIDRFAVVGSSMAVE